MKKVLSLLMVVLMMVTLMACNAGTTTKTEEPKKTEATPTTQAPATTQKAETTAPKKLTFGYVYYSASTTGIPMTSSVSKMHAIKRV
jgi:fructoselysine-6-P-deglycase FrlB-like protein